MVLDLGGEGYLPPSTYVSNADDRVEYFGGTYCFTQTALMGYACCESAAERRVSRRRFKCGFPWMWVRTR